MDTSSSEKRDENAEHVEVAYKLDGDGVHHAGFGIEEVRYGKSGAKAFFSSPYVFGAALLASMGGFSYGYGRLCFLDPCWTIISDPDVQIRGSYLSFSSCRNSASSIRRSALQPPTTDSIQVS